MFSFPVGIKTKHTDKKIKCKTQNQIENQIEKELQIFNDANHIPKRTSRDKKDKKDKKTDKTKTKRHK